VDPQTPYTNVILHIVYLGSSILWWYPFPRPKRRQEESEMDNKDQVSILPGTDGLAAFLKPDTHCLETKLHVLSVGPSAMEEHTEGNVDEESALYTASKLDLQEILQKHGISSSLTFDKKTNGEEDREK
jgi:hypothetical protein